MIQNMDPVTKKNMQTPSSIRNGHLYIKDAQCAETNEKLYLRFLVFELFLPKRLQKMRIFFFFISGLIYRKDPDSFDNDFLLP